jgi:WD repeat-containing protein 35
LAEIKGEG